MMHDIAYFKKEPWMEPERNYYVLIASNGCFVAKRNAVMLAIQRVEPSDLFKFASQEQEEVVVWTAPKIPADVVAQAVTFLRLAKDTNGTEAFMSLLYSPQLKQYRAVVPEQEATAAYVRTLEMITTDEGWYSVAFLHGHPGGAFSSSVDLEDQSKADGLHIVVGNLSCAVPQFECTLVAFGRGCKCAPEDVLENPFVIPSSWLKKVHRGR